jgi:hypothetical protein
MRFNWIAFLATTTLATWAPAMAQDSSSTQTVLQANTGVWTYPRTGTVTTYWIETPGGGLVVIDVQRDLIHAAQRRRALPGVLPTLVHADPLMQSMVSGPTSLRMLAVAPSGTRRQRWAAATWSQLES